jgi:hypothetical protein
MHDSSTRIIRRVVKFEESIYLFPRRCYPLVHSPALHGRHPKGQEATDEGVRGDSSGSVVLCVVEAEFVVPSEAGRCDEEAAVAEGQTDVG